MRSFFRTLLRRRPAQIHKPPQRHNTMLASSSMSATVAYACSISTPTALGAVPQGTEAKAHHLKNGKGFQNPWDSWKETITNGPAFLASQIWKMATGKTKWPDTTPPTVPVVTPNFLTTRTGSSALRATWLGHACYYVEFPSGLRVLFDPVFEDRCSPLSFMGPKRYTPPPCAITDLPFVDLVVISHSHYDHLSHPTIMALHEKYPQAHYLVGLGLKKWINECGIQNVEELDWWQDVDVVLSPETGEKRISTTSASSPPTKSESNITARISCLPCQHASARTAFDKGHTLWASWAVSSSGKSVWFGGDTGYRAVPLLPKDVDDYAAPYDKLPVCPAFAQIGALRGPFDLGLIPIGAYDPRYIMSPMHANPFDSVNIFLDTKCKRAMGIHWGTWVLTTEEVMEPPRLLKEALRRKGIKEEGVFDVCSIGEAREF